MNVRNHIHLTGNLGANPKTVILASGKTATEFSLATNKYYRDSEGKRQTVTDWHTIKAFGKLAELFDTYLEKGSQISIVGTMRYRKWTDKHDQARKTAEVIADEFTFLDGGRKKDDDKHQTEPSHEMLVAAEPVSYKAKARRKKKATAEYGEVIEAAEAVEA